MFAMYAFSPITIPRRNSADIVLDAMHGSVFRAKEITIGAQKP